jgi:hypothetical protein
MNRPLKNVSSSVPIFDASEAVCWVVEMANSVADAKIKNAAPGVLYTFVFIQNEVGGHTFTWPGNCLNPPPINTAPNGKTAANFIGAGGGTIASNTAATWI